tara:strand:+ start:22830 stop:23798 length:969 start_codon:yes stop_codon:yes gene_type:complete
VNATVQLASKNVRIAVICGGSSNEAEVSRVSGTGVADALRENYTDVTVLELNAGLTAALQQLNPDVVFPILHGPPGEDGTIQGFLEILNIPYVGSGVHASAVAMDKPGAKLVFANAGLPLAAQVIVDVDDDIDETVAVIDRQLGTDVVIKPANQGSALGVQFARNPQEIREAIQAARNTYGLVLVESCIEGREITVGVLDTKTRPIAFPVIEIVTPDTTWYDFEHRYTQGLSEHIVPAHLPDNTLTRLQEMAIRAHVALGCRDLSRADFVVSDDREVLLEVNTLPGMTPTSLYPDGAAAWGLDFASLMVHLAERAMGRVGTQ